MTLCGFDSLPTQVTTKRSINGLAFNLLVLGPKGIGKTTLIDSLFDIQYCDSVETGKGESKVTLRIKDYSPANENINLKLTIIETKNFNDQLDRTKIYKPILDYVEERYEEFYRNELKVQESKYNEIEDSRVHCCIYMISPTARGLKPIDLVTMEQLHDRVCLIPVIGRADQLTMDERESIKQSIMKVITERGINIYSSHRWRHAMPFAVAASTTTELEHGKYTRVRVFPWGKMYIDKHTDISLLRNLLLSEMLSFIDLTDQKHYEMYRRSATQKFKAFCDYKNKYEQEKSKQLKEIERVKTASIE